MKTKTDIKYRLQAIEEMISEIIDPFDASRSRLIVRKEELEWVLSRKI